MILMSLMLAKKGLFCCYEDNSVLLGLVNREKYKKMNVCEGFLYSRTIMHFFGCILWPVSHVENQCRVQAQ